MIGEIQILTWCVLGVLGWFLGASKGLFAENQLSAFLWMAAALLLGPLFLVSVGYGIMEEDRFKDQENEDK